MSTPTRLAPVLTRNRRYHDDRWFAELNVETGDEFFFDHELDHVPGMLILCGLLELAMATADVDAGHQIRTSLTFHSLCELALPIILTAAPAGSGTWTIRADQNSVCVADGDLELQPSPAHTATYPAGTATRVPAEMELVHRSRQENVMVGAPQQADGVIAAEVLAPPEGHFLRADVHRPEGLIEAGRQFATLLQHVAAGRPADTQLLWQRVSADVPVAFPIDAALSLRWREAPIRASFQLHHDLLGPDGQLGALTIHGRSVTQAAYARFRQAGNGG